MTIAELERIEASEETQVLRWRLATLLRSGFALGDAVAIAARRDIDLHEAADLVRRGCPSATALRILC